MNYLAAHHFTRVDLSRDDAYTLSNKTTRYLKDKAVREREKPVKWIMAFRRSSPFYERVRALAEDYVRLSGGKIELEIVDPGARSTDRTAEVAAIYGLPLTKDLMIMDARTGPWWWSAASVTSRAGPVRGRAMRSAKAPAESSPSSPPRPRA